MISDGGLSAGLTFEGLNQAGHLDKDLIVVLNDNEHFIDPRVGAVSSFLSKQFTTDLGVRLQRNLSHLLHSLPSGENLKHLARKLRDSFVGLVTPGFLFESLGFQYVGPINGHDIAEMVTTLENVKKIDGPTLIHVMTKKGKGYAPAEKDPVKYHAVTPFHVLTGKPKKEKGPIASYTDVFAQARVTIHVPRGPYARVLAGIPTIRVFEALACGIPLICSPWSDREGLFPPGTYLSVASGAQMTDLPPIKPHATEYRRHAVVGPGCNYKTCADHD